MNRQAAFSAAFSAAMRNGHTMAVVENQNGFHVVKVQFVKPVGSVWHSRTLTGVVVSIIN